jgi:hypothetical protein
MRPIVRLAALNLVLVVLPITFGTSFVAASTTNPPSCTRSQITLSASASETTYLQGSLVHVTVTLRNHSLKACSYSTGTFSPSYSLVNSAGVTVWGSCWFNGGPAPCPYLLVHRVLARGATYTDRLTWDQRTGHPDEQVPPGRYRFSVSFSGLHGTAVTIFSVV